MTVRILVVEDDARLCEMIACALQEEGYHVTQATGGTAAIGLLRQSGADDLSYDVVLTDIVMDQIGGIEVMYRVRNLPAAPEVILLTGHGSLETAIAAVDAGAFAYLLKPCPIDQVLERVAAAVDSRMNRLRQTMDADAWMRIADFVSRVRYDASPAGPPAPPACPPQETPHEQPAAQQPGPSEPAQATDTMDADHDRFLWVGRLCVDTYRHEIWFDDQRLHVTPTEYTLLSCLAASPERVVSYTDLARHTHGCHVAEAEARELLGWHVHNLRHKFDRRYIVSVRSVGYMLVDPTRLRMS